jgi:hypothetical protein
MEIREAQARIEQKAAQNREALRQILMKLGTRKTEALIQQIIDGQESESPLYAIICRFADVGFCQIISEWEDPEDPPYRVPDDD